jgi:hypothetical protein
VFGPNVNALSTVDRKINADADDAIILKIRSEWSWPRKVLFYYRRTARNIPVRITSSAIITSDGSQRRNEYFSETRAAATRDQFCSEKNSFPRRMRYIYRRVERINNAGTMRIAYARNEFLFQWPKYFSSSCTATKAFLFILDGIQLEYRIFRLTFVLFFSKTHQRTFLWFQFIFRQINLVIL